MAHIAFFILFTLTLSSTTTIHARESQFFNKLSKESQPLNTNNQVPNFIPQTEDSGSSYGLYGHGSGQLPPSATTANLPDNYNPVAYTTPIHTTTQDVPNEFKDPQMSQYNSRSSVSNAEKQGFEFDDAKFMEREDGENMYKSEQQGSNAGYDSRSSVYNAEKQGFDDVKFMNREDGGNMYKSEQQGNNARYNSQSSMYNAENQGNGRYNPQMQGVEYSKYGTSNNAYMYNTEKQGMSDTRFLENGKYYYDLDMENRNANVNMKRGFNSRNEYNTQGYYGNNGNSYDRYNSNGGYGNQEEFQVDQYNP